VDDKYLISAVIIRSVTRGVLVMYRVSHFRGKPELPANIAYSRDETKALWNDDVLLDNIVTVKSL
jgi:hypothetical protein